MEEVIGSTPIFSTQLVSMQGTLRRLGRGHRQKTRRIGPDIVHYLPNYVIYGVMYFIYIIFSKKADRYYVGESSDIQARLASHRKGISKYTSIAKDWELVYFEEFHTRGEAIIRERAIKRMKSRKYIESLIKP